MIVHTVPALFTANDGLIGGAERYVFELARHMADVVPTSLVTYGATSREESAGGLRIRVIGRPWRVRGQAANPFAFRLLPEVLSARVIHCHQQHIVTSSVAALTARLSGRRVFCSDLGGGGFDISSYVSTDRWYHGHLHISEYSRKVFGHRDKPWAHVIWGGVDTSRFAPAPGSPRDGGVLYVGRILPHKGIDGVIRGLPDGVSLRIVGPPHHPGYLADLKTLAQGKPVTFHHDLNDAALIEEYRRALCVVLPSVYDDMYGQHSDVPELLGQTLLEGMACGAPGLCTNVASMPEIVTHGQTGFVVPPGNTDAMRDAIGALATDPALVNRLGTAACADVHRRFTWPAVVDACLKIYGVERP